MSNHHVSKLYHINMQYGKADLNELIDELAKQTISKNSGGYLSSNLMVKKTQSSRRAI